MNKSLVTITCLVSMCCFSVHLKSAELPKIKILNPEDYQKYDTRYGEIEKLGNDNCPVFEKILLYNEAHAIALAMLVYTQASYQEANNPNKPKKQGKNFTLIKKWADLQKLWVIRSESTQSMLSVLHIESPCEEQRKQIDAFLTQSNLLRSDCIKSIGRHFNTVDEAHIRVHQALQEDPYNAHAKLLEQQIKNNKDVLQLFAAQMDRAKDVVAELNQKNKDLRQENEKLKQQEKLARIQLNAEQDQRTTATDNDSDSDNTKNSTTTNTQETNTQENCIIL